jgi:hypothetical protein
MKGMPPASTIYYWSKSYKEFGRLLDQAREARKDIIFDKILDLATGEMAREEIQATKLKIATLQWAYESTI